MNIKNQQGMTLIELIVIVLVIVILAGSVFLWIDPLAKIGKAKDEKRRQDVLMLSNAIAEYTNNHGGALPILGTVTTTKRVICSSQGGGSLTCGSDTNTCISIVHDDFYNSYMPALPIEPNKTVNTDTGYYLQRDSNGNLVVGACTTYGASAISSTPRIKITCDVYAGGNCWFVGGTANQDCNTVCSANSLTCATNVTYGPDVDNASSGYCALNKALGGTCSSGCVLGNGSNYLPITNTAGDICFYRTVAFDCDDSINNYYSVCPCK